MQKLKRKEVRKYKRILRENFHLINERKNSELSGGEKIISEFLKKQRIRFSRERHWVGLINPKTEKPLFFDFHLWDYRVVIEFDGPQHFKPVYGEEKLQDQKYRDSLKNEFCRKKKIKLLRIPYWTKDIENEICKFFDKHFPIPSPPLSLPHSS